MTNSYLLTKKRALKAIEIVSASFTRAIELGESERTSVHIVVMDPAKQPEFGYAFEESILCESSIGENSEKYIPIARAKARFTWLYKIPSQVGQQLYPHLFTEGMTKYGGSAYLHHITVGTSGVDYQMDQWVSEMVACTCRALCVGEMIDIFNSEIKFFGIETT